MGKVKQAIALSLLLMILTVLFVTGCSDKETTTPVAETTTTAAAPTTPAGEFTQEELQQIVADSKLATTSADTYRLDMTLATEMSIDGDAQSGGMSMTANMAFDIPQNNAMMSFTMTGDPGTGSGTETTEADLYLIEDYMYMKLNIPEVGVQWVKVSTNEEILDTFNVNMIQEEMGGMELPASIEFIKYETVRGIECYILKYVPNEEYLRDYAVRQMPEGMDIDWEKVGDISDIYKELTYTAWIAKDTKYIHKMEIDGSIVFSSDFAKLEGTTFDKATSDISGSLEMYDYNAQFTIDLPEEAEGAIEISPDIFLGQ